MIKIKVTSIVGFDKGTCSTDEMVADDMKEMSVMRIEVEVSGEMARRREGTE